uniref:Molybdenum cofactor sulfurase n=1 Tax=Globisporangium ultimum (strain ATCC 200006 / CBS 805.95 / DAOM BR144) TaxID=431595 RepID=K3WYH6_GLOUD
MAACSSKGAFLRAFPQYGYGKDDAHKEKQLAIDRMRAQEFAHMEGSVYLDHAGATMYSSVQLQRVFAELSTGLYGNPHSTSTTVRAVGDVKRRVMRFFSAREDEYELIFTSGTTAALKLVGECFPWQHESRFSYSMDSHTSVLGIRGYAAKHGADTVCIPLDEMQQMEEDQNKSNDAEVSTSTEEEATQSNVPLNLFAFPAECNFSGSRHPLSLVDRVRNGQLDEQQPFETTKAQGSRWLVLVDAAKYVSTHKLELSKYKPDFVVCSFYKMFGYPTGLGALLVKKTALPLLQKVYYGGGTVQSILATQHVMIPKGNSEAGAGFADGTQSFLSILSLHHGLDQLESLGMASIDQHTAALTSLLYTKLTAMTHWNDRPVCKIYGNHHRKSLQGPIVTCNFMRPDGSYVGYSEVSKLAAIHNIQLRTGCFCNPGACQTYLQLRDADVLAGIEAGHVCGDDMDLVNGLPTGAVRISIGYMTTFEDIVTFTNFVIKYFVSTTEPVKQMSTTNTLVREPRVGVYLRKITLFPIKSCGGMVVDAWPVGSRGLLFDREWAIVDVATSKAFSLKELPELCHIHPVVDLKNQTLAITFYKADDNSDDSDTFVLPLHADIASSHRNKDADTSRDLQVCADACKGRDVGDEVSEWLSAHLQRQCAFVCVAANHLRDSQASSKSTQRTAQRAAPGDSSPTSEEAVVAVPKSKIGFANQAQYLLISSASIANFNVALRAVDATLDVNEDAFRANFIVDGCEAFEEDTWTRLCIEQNTDSDSHSDEDGVIFDVSGACSRCAMINIDPKTGAFHRAPLQALSKYRRERSSIFFGQFLTRRTHAEGAALQWVRVRNRILCF